MTLSLETSCGFEQDKIAPFAVHYTRGKCLDLGCGPRKCWPDMIGIDLNPNSNADIKAPIDTLPLFASNSMDAVFSSHALEDFAEEDISRVLKEWSRVIKVGGNLVLYVPSANLYPKIGEPGANLAHKVNIYPGDVERWLKGATECGWTQLEQEERNELNEYSLFLVFQKRDDGQWVEDIWQRNPGGKKRCLVIRYGAIGDAIILSSIFPLIKEQGYFLTVNMTPEGRDILLHNPHVDEWLLQVKDQVPNTQLGPYWEVLSRRYDKVINLCESIEGSLLALPGRLQYHYPVESRRKLFGTVNYLERAHEIAGVPARFQPKFHTSDNERAWAHAQKAKFNGPVVAWAINGSAVHKVWPWVHVVGSWFLSRTPGSLVLIADPGIGKELQTGIIEAMTKDGCDMSRVHGMAGQWTIRNALTFAQVADCVIGPETGTLNAVCMENMPKVIYLSHSSPDNLTKHWRNTITLTPTPGSAPCWPCHRLHYSWEGCHQDEKSSAALCAAAISPEHVFEALALALGARKAA